jgi:DNA (cytosine-5)-methyltransferase 1
MKRLKGLSLFSNVGIAEAYLKDVGVDVLIANELIPKRAEFYKAVYPDTDVICGDITSEDLRTEIVNKALAAGVDFIIATPPCQGMSVAGSRNTFDERNQLIFYAIDVIKRVKPRYVLLENVPRQLVTKIIVNDQVMYIPDYIKHELEGTYNFNKETLVRAMDYGVPQIRERNIYLITRKDCKVTWEFPEKEPEVTLEKAIGKLPSLDPMLREGMDMTLEKFPDFEKKRAEGLKVSKWHYPPKHSWKQVEWMMHTPTGKSAIYNEKYYPQKADGTPVKAHHNHYRRMKWDMPSRTITQNNGVISSLCCVHPGRKYVSGGMELYSDARVLSVYELLIVTSLPEDWPIPDWADETFIRNVIGEGIPPLLIKKIMEELMKQI